MKKTRLKIAIISIFLILSMVIAVSARQSAYFSSYSATVGSQSNGIVAFSGDIMAVGIADELGIAVMNIIDADTGTIIKTVTNNYRTNNSFYTYSVSGQGEVGHRYYAEVTYYVIKGNGSESKYLVTGVTTAKK